MKIFGLISLLSILSVTGFPVRDLVANLEQEVSSLRQLNSRLVREITTLRLIITDYEHRFQYKEAGVHHTSPSFSEFNSIHTSEIDSMSQSAS